MKYSIIVGSSLQINFEMETKIMDGKIVEINQKSLLIKEFRGQRVVTFKDIDRVHERPEGTAGRNFRDNKEHFIEGEDYFRRNSSEAKREFDITAPNGLYLLTEQGYLMLVKTFTDDLAWSVQRQLVNNYFKLHSVHSVTYQYPIPPAAMESATNAGRLFERIMRSEGVPPHEIAMAVRLLFQQAGIDIPEYVVKVPAYEQYTLDIVTR